MIIRAYGNEKLPKAIALHPMMADGASMVKLAGKLQEKYCIIAPDLSGQGDDTGDFESAEKEADTLYTYLKEKGWLEIPLIYGASLGAAVGLELLAKPGIKAGTVVFDGCPLYKNAFLIRPLLTFVFLKKHGKAVANPGISVERMTQIYGPLFGPGMGKSFERMSEKSIRNIIAACSKCAFHQYSAETEEHLHFEYGSGDSDLKGAKKNLPKQYPAATLTVRDGYAHCQYMSSLEEAYGEVLKKYMEKDGGVQNK